MTTRFGFFSIPIVFTTLITRTSATDNSREGVYESHHFTPAPTRICLAAVPISSTIWVYTDVRIPIDSFFSIFVLVFVVFFLAYDITRNPNLHAPTDSSARPDNGPRRSWTSPASHYGKVDI
ncbi:hypothetical protein MD484_g7153, partial [Candolleomyces efflorescens]